MPLAGKLAATQELMAAGDQRARRIYESIGVYLGYAIAQYAAFYELRHVLVLGRVMTGEGGGVILSTARRVLQREFPAVEEGLRLHMPGEEEKRLAGSGGGGRSPELPLPMVAAPIRRGLHRPGDLVQHPRPIRVQPLISANCAANNCAGTMYGMGVYKSCGPPNCRLGAEGGSAAQAWRRPRCCSRR